MSTKAIRYGVNNNGKELKQVVHTHRTSCRGGWPTGFDFLNPNPHSGHLSYLFTATKCSIQPIQYVTPHFRDRRGAASPRYRNRAKITILMCGQKQYPVWFSCRRKSCPIYLEHSLSNCFPPASLCNFLTLGWTGQRLKLNRAEKCL